MLDTHQFCSWDLMVAFLTVWVLCRSSVSWGGFTDGVRVRELGIAGEGWRLQQRMFRVGRMVHMNKCVWSKAAAHFPSLPPTPFLLYFSFMPSIATSQTLFYLPMLFTIRKQGQKRPGLLPLLSTVVSLPSAYNSIW